VVSIALYPKTVTNEKFTSIADPNYFGTSLESENGKKEKKR
jgi:hypothetical protein